MNDDAFNRYVVSRGYADPKTDGREAILNNEPLLAELAGLWRGHRSAIEALLGARIEPIKKELVMDATPYEVVFLRQSMIEVAFIGDDLEAYANEYERRQKEKDGGIPETIVTPAAPIIEDNAAPSDNGAETSSM